MLRFVTADADTFGQKRKQAPKACDGCRRKKKRCDHQATFVASGRHSSSDNSSRPAASGISAKDVHEGHNEDQLRSDVPGVLGHPSDNRADQIEEFLDGAEDAHRGPNERRPRSDVQGVLDHPSDKRSDQNEELLEGAENSEPLGSRFIGDLNPEGVLLAATSPATTRGRSPSNSIGIWLRENVRERNHGRDALCEQLPATLFYGSTSVVQKALVPILIQECLSLLPPPANIHRLSSFYFEKIHPIFPVIERNRLQDLSPKSPSRVLLQQGICLAASKNPSLKPYLKMSDGHSLQTHGEFSGRLFAAMRMSIEMGVVTDKVVLIQALALMSLFVDGPDGRALAPELCARAVQHVHSLGLHLQGRLPEKHDQYATTLLCCIWALDRLNAATYGRPVLMHERDMRTDMEACFQQQEPCFCLLLGVMALLDKVIQIYRPEAASKESELETKFLSFEDLLVSCAGLQIPIPLLATIETLYHAVAILSCRPRSFEISMRSSASYNRQTLSALQVTSIVEQELPHQLILLPFVPYAVSLSLSIAYREMRHSKVPMYRTRAQAHLRTNCKILEQLGETFWSASIMADMGKSTLKELDRVYSTVIDSQQRGIEQHGNFPTGYGRSVNSSDHRNLSNEEIPSCRENRLGTPTAPLQDLDFSVFNDMPDVDVFGMFDPHFDLNGIDACFQGNLDLSFPTILQ